MVHRDVFISMATLALASISISQIPSLLTYFLLVSNPTLSIIQLLVTGNGEEISEAKNFVNFYLCPSPCPPDPDTVHGTLGEQMGQ